MSKAIGTFQPSPGPAPVVALRAGPEGGHGAAPPFGAGFTGEGRRSMVDPGNRSGAGDTGEAGPAEQADPDRRAARRVRLLKFAWYCGLEGAAGTRLEGLARSCDVSVSGVALWVAQPVPVGTRLFVEIVSGELCLSAVGLVVRSVAADGGQVQLGIHFQVVPPNDQVALTRFCGHVRA